MLVIEMHVIWYAYTCIMQRRTIVVNSHNETNVIWATIISITLLVPMPSLIGVRDGGSGGGS